MRVKQVGNVMHAESLLRLLRFSSSCSCFVVSGQEKCYYFFVHNESFFFSLVWPSEFNFLNNFNWNDFNFNGWIIYAKT